MIKKENKIIDLKGANSTMKLGFVLYSVMVVAFILCACVAYAAGDPISTVNKLSEFIFSLIISSSLMPDCFIASVIWTKDFFFFFVSGYGI